MTLDRMLERAEQSYPEKFAILTRAPHGGPFGVHSPQGQPAPAGLTFRQLNNQVNALASGLLNLGMKKGDVVAMLLPKTIEAVVAFLGVVRAGGIIAPINMRLKSNTLRVAFNQLNPFAVITDHLFYPLLTKHFIPFHPNSRIISTSKAGPASKGGPVSLPVNPPKLYFFDDLLSRESERRPDVKIEESDVAYLNYTSGTTGIPKGAVTTHGNLAWNTKGAVEMLKMDHRDVHLCMFPMYAHPHEIFCRSIYLGGTTVLLDSMYPRTIARVIEQFRVTCLMAVPPFYRSLFPVGRSKEFDFSSLRISEAGGVYSPPDLCKEFEEIFGQRFLPVWGSTETTGIALATSPVDPAASERLGSMGKPCPGYETHVLAPGGREADTDEVGELIISGPGVVQGYFNLSAETEAAFHAGVWHTGDMVRRDDAGFYYFLGRRSGLMKVAGLKVYPQEVEAVLHSHPQVEEAAVIALPDPLRGEVPKAFVVPKSGGTDDLPPLDAKILRAFCRLHLADYKVPADIEIRSSLPKSETGKISHVELAQEALDALADDEVKSLQRRVQTIDSKILEMLNARVELILRIISLKDQMDPAPAGLYSALRGDEAIARIIEENKGPIYDEALEEIFRKIIALDLIIQS